MNELSNWVLRWAWPAVAILFVGLYVMYLLAGADAESALVRAGMTGLLLAVLGRVALWLMEMADQPNPAEQRRVPTGRDRDRE